MVQLGILGTGMIANAMAETVQVMNENGLHDVQLYGAASRDPEKARAFAARHGGIRAYGSYEEMLEDDAIQLVYVASPHSHHCEHTLLCLRHGKNVLCEKAFAANAAQAREMVDYADSHGLLVTEAILTRYHPMRRLLEEVLASGVIGTPQIITANLGYPVIARQRIHDPNLAGGALLDVGVYAINFAEMVFGRADGVHAQCVRSPEGVDLIDGVTLTWNSGKMALLTSTVTAMGDRNGVIYGSEGFAVMDNINDLEAIRVYDRKYQLIREIPRPALRSPYGFDYELLETAACVEAGKTECPSMPHAETVHVMEIMDACRRQMGVRYPFEKA